MLKIIKKQPVETVEETKEETTMKVNWSLKKKILVGLGVIGTGVLGVLAYGKCTESNEVQVENEDEDENELDDCDDEELRELEALEKAEETEK